MKPFALAFGLILLPALATAAPPPPATPAAKPGTPPPPPAAPPPPDPKVIKKLEADIRTALNQSGPAIDACVARYTSENPAADGKASVDLTVQKTGQVVRASVECTLDGARTLRECLELAGKAVKLPAPGQDGATLKVSVIVKKDAKFKLLSPDEKPPEAQKEQASDGFVNFLPQAWYPAWK